MPRGDATRRGFLDLRLHRVALVASAVAAAGEIVKHHGWPRQNAYRRVREASLDSVDLLFPDVRIARGLSKSAGLAVLRYCFQPVSGNRLA